MADPYIIKEAKLRRGKAVIAAWIGGSVLAATLIIGGTAFGLHQLSENEDHGVVADQETTFDDSGEHEGGEGFGENDHERGEGGQEHGEDD